MVITVALESRGDRAARGPIRRARPTHPALIDRDHVVAELYNIVNVPQAVWIDETGRIVRPAESAGAALTMNVSRVRELRRIYLDAIRDWVRNGESSQHAFTPEAARAHLAPYTDEVARAHACFHLGRHLFERGDRKQGKRFLEEAVELHPDSWSFFRQMKNLEHILGSAGWDMMRRVRERRRQGHDYYPLPDMAGLEPNSES